MKRLTAYTIQDEAKFCQVSVEVQKQDYCLSKEQHELGVIAIAVPILNAQGSTVAALNCIVQIQFVTEHQIIQQILPLLRNTAYELRGIVKKSDTNGHFLF